MGEESSVFSGIIYDKATDTPPSGRYVEAALEKHASPEDKAVMAYFEPNKDYLIPVLNRDSSVIGLTYKSGKEIRLSLALDIGSKLLMKHKFTTGFIDELAKKRKDYSEIMGYTPTEIIELMHITEAEKTKKRAALKTAVFEEKFQRLAYIAQIAESEAKPARMIFDVREAMLEPEHIANLATGSKVSPPPAPAIKTEPKPTLPPKPEPKDTSPINDFGLNDEIRDVARALLSASADTTTLPHKTTKPNRKPGTQVA